MRDYENYDCVENTAAASYFVRFLLKPPYLFALSEQKIRFQVGLLKKVSSPTCGHFCSYPLCICLCLVLFSSCICQQLLVLRCWWSFLRSFALSPFFMRMLFLWSIISGFCGGQMKCTSGRFMYFEALSDFFSGRNEENDTFYKWMRVSLWMESKIMEQIKSWAVWVLLTFPCITLPYASRTFFHLRFLYLIFPYNEEMWSRLVMSFFL